VISPFIPLGDFDIYRHVRVNAETAKGCLQRLEENNVMIPEFVRDGLRRSVGERLRVKPSDKVEKRMTPKEVQLAGQLVWIPTKAGKVSCYWPGIALHLDTDRDLIPDIGMKELKSGQTAETHRFAIYFGEKTFEWVKVHTLLDFASNADRLKREQTHMLSRSKYRSALDIAFERLGKHNTKVDGAMQKKYEIDIAENKLKERLGNLRDTPPTTCGKCHVCLAPSRERVEVTSSKRPLRRGNAKLPSKVGMHDDVCPQLQVC
jgi:hypothetical protein